LQVLDGERAWTLPRQAEEHRDDGGQRALLLYLGRQGRLAARLVRRPLDQAGQQGQRVGADQAVLLEQPRDRLREAGQQIQDRAERAAAVLGDAAAFEPGLGGDGPRELAEQAGLADAGLARDQRDARVPGLGALPGAVQQRHLLLALDERRLAPRPAA